MIVKLNAKPVKKSVAGHGRPRSRRVEITQERPDVTRDQIVAYLRGRIVSGELSPGSRLPTSRGLKSILGANLVTIGRAIDQLRKEGFVETQGVKGSFVANHPPHLYQYALVFPSHPSENHWPRFWDAMAREAAVIGQEGPCKLPIYHDVHQGAYPNSDGYMKLVQDLRSNRLGGLIFATDPWGVQNTQILMEPGVACVSIMPPNPEKYPNMATVNLDTTKLYEKAIDYFVSRGRKHLAVLTADDFDTAFRSIELEALRRGMETRPYWGQSVSPSNARPARACMHLLMTGWQPDRPDALLITDDNLLADATAGLNDAGVKVPRDLDVVAHCNFPWPTQGTTSAKRLGFDARQVLRACVRSIESQKQTGKLPKPEMIPALFEEELDLQGAK